MYRRYFLLATAAALTARSALAADRVPYGDSLTFAAYRKGQKIGTHAMAFQDDAGRLLVATSIDFTVHALGLVAYRYRHRAREVWSNGRFMAIATQTDDDGAAYALEARHEGGSLIVRRREPQQSVKTSAGDAALQQPAWIREVDAANILPTTHWNIEQVRQSALLNTQTGKVAHMAVTEAGRETIATAHSSLPATHYSYAGDLRMEQWFDDRRRWVKANFRAPDGSTIEYILQE